MHSFGGFAPRKPVLPSRFTSTKIWGAEVFVFSFSWEAETRFFPLQHVQSHNSARSISRTFQQSKCSKHLVHLTTHLQYSTCFPKRMLLPQNAQYGFPNCNNLPGSIISLSIIKRIPFTRMFKKSNTIFSRCINLSLTFFCPKTKYRTDFSRSQRVDSTLHWATARWATVDSSLSYSWLFAVLQLTHCWVTFDSSLSYSWLFVTLRWATIAFLVSFSWLFAEPQLTLPWNRFLES